MREISLQIDVIFSMFCRGPCANLSFIKWRVPIRPGIFLALISALVIFQEANASEHR
jgi:hypothetical protein